MKENIYNFEERLIRFAGEIIFFCKSLPSDDTGRYYGNQVMRASGSAALNYGEAQGTTTGRDFIHKMSLVLKELRECQVALKIVTYVSYGDKKQCAILVKEATEMAKISAKMILNKKG